MALEEGGVVDFWESLQDDEAIDAKLKDLFGVDIDEAWEQAKAYPQVFK
jgi:hypothetical protein